METSNRVGVANIIIKTEPAQMRYDSLTDWYFQGDHLIVKHIDLGDSIMNHLLVTHEIQEAMMCKFMGITSKQVDDFDTAYEKERHPTDTTSEPGDDPSAPYHKAHCAAEMIERVLALALHVQWGIYMDVCERKFAEVKRIRREAKLNNGI